ncbi:helix-turn-helix domain-containing protein [Actinosynnema sp. NPDC053489]|uniref:helix-turn-helix domain-containing protein n=1 Tax=Actinosynnema sp. NPDC053489 TaxID=3363916 RepID=UPI0037C8EBB4
MAIGSTRGKRRLGRHLRPILERSGLKVDEVVKRSRVSRPTIIRMLSGDALARWPTLAMVLDVIGATPEERTRALQLWEVADVDPAALGHARDLPADHKRFRLDELEAVRERSLDPALVPALFRTAEYAEALARSARRGGGDRHAAAERTALLFGERPLEVHALVDEAALRRLVGGPGVMRDQLDHLLSLAALPNVTVQVLPYDVGAYGAHAGCLTLLEFPEADEPRSAYAEALTGLIAVDDEQVDALSEAWDDAARQALTPEDSLKFVQAARDALEDR